MGMMTSIKNNVVDLGNWWAGRDLLKEIASVARRYSDGTPIPAINPVAEGYVPITRKEAEYLWGKNYHGNTASFDTKPHSEMTGEELWMKSPLGNSEDKIFKAMGPGYHVDQVVNQDVRDLYEKAASRYKSSASNINDIPSSGNLAKMGIFAPVAMIGGKNYDQLINEQSLQEPTFDPVSLLAPGGMLGNIGGESISALLKYFTGK